MKKIICYSCTFLCFVLLSCKKDFVALDISGKTLVVNGPGDNLQTTNNVITFWWDALDGAEKYSLQVVKPNFNQVAQLILDTSVTTTRFNLSMLPGSYQWRIKATNTGYATDYRTFNLRIDTTNNLSSLLVNLLNPVNGLVSGKTKLTFNWGALIAANKYRLQINGGAIKDTLLYNTTSFTYTLPAAANANTAFTWNVRALNDNSQTQFNTLPFTFTVDLKAPSGPGLASPSTGSLVKDTIKLVWNRTTTDAVFDSVYVADDSLFTNILNQVGTDQTKLLISELNRDPNTGNGFYWWRVRSFDAVGNRSVTSNKNKFKLIP